MESSVEFATKCIQNNYKHVLEFGVYKGDTIQKLRNSLDESYKIFGFDSFEGLPEDWIGTPCFKGCFGVNGNIPNITNVVFYKGWFSETLPKYKSIEEPISLLHLDCDLYSSTKEVLYSLNNVILEGTIICFDEWLYTKCDGTLHGDHEQQCFYDWCKDNSREFEFVDFVDSTSCGHERKIVRILK